MSENLPVRTGGSMPAIRSVDDLKSIGELFESSAMFGCTQQGQGMVLAMTCIMDNMTPLQFIQTYHLVKGRPSMRADAMLAGLLERGGTYKIIARDAERAAVEMEYKGAKATFTFSFSEAKAERFVYEKDGKTLKDNWATDRGRMQMLWARVVSDGVRTVCPIVVKGTYTPEEVADFDDRGAPRRAEPYVAPAPIKQPEPTGAAEPQSAAVEVLPREQAAGQEQAAEPASASGAPVDPSLMPYGRMIGTPWSKMTDGQLEKALILKSDKFTDAHRDAIRAEIERRKAAQS